MQIFQSRAWGVWVCGGRQQGFGIPFNKRALQYRLCVGWWEKMRSETTLRKNSSFTKLLSFLVLSCIQSPAAGIPSLSYVHRNKIIGMKAARATEHAEAEPSTLHP